MNNAEKELSEKPWTHPTKKVTDAQMLKIYAKTLNEVVEKMEIYEKALNKIVDHECERCGPLAVKIAEGALEEAKSE